MLYDIHRISDLQNETKKRKNERPEMPLILGMSGTQYVAMGVKLLSSNCGAHLVESYCKESNVSDTNWLRYLFFIIFDQNLVEYIASLLG